MRHGYERSMAKTTEVLVVHLEDNPGDRDLLALALREVGANVRVIAAENAVQLYNLMRLMSTSPPHLVVVDLNLPLIKGHTVIRDLKSDPYWRKVPAVVLTSSLLESDKRDCEQLGVDAYLLKPQRYEEYLEIAKSLKQYVKKDWTERVARKITGTDLDRLATPPPSNRTQNAG